MFELGKVYRRRALHEEFKGQEQCGIVTPSEHPVVFLITGEGGHEYGYHDEWLEDGTFRYFGEGQSGNMTFVRGNRAIRDHAFDGKDLHVFEKVSPAHLRYRGQFVCAGYEIVPGVLGLDHAPRSAIVFLLAPIDGDDEDDRLAERGRLRPVARGAARGRPRCSDRRRRAVRGKARGISPLSRGPRVRPSRSCRRRALRARCQSTTARTWTR